MVENYFHSVFEATKSIADRLRTMTGLYADDNALAETSFSTSNLLVKINHLKTDTDRSEHLGLGNLIKGIFGFIENQGYKSDFYSDAIVRGGAAYLIHKDLQLDASTSTSLKNTPSILYGGIGFSWRYDANYKEVRMKIDSNKKSDSKSKKTKKRKDVSSETDIMSYFGFPK